VTLTAGAAPTFADIAEIASEVTKRSIRLELVAPDAWIAAQTAAGQPEFVARSTLGMYLAARAGFFAGTDPLLTALLGRDPRTVGEQLAAPSVH
jgi:uncharacterized protein YbjT (DUF2867 family)